MRRQILHAQSALARARMTVVHIELLALAAAIGLIGAIVVATPHLRLP
ncbi:hypothetical protein BJ123_101300 [Rhodopseudomonas thermotolerans]|uniref:Uncharacterized protein n=2 Tax=Rhodopseudomonas TaxID=1073 RepID=A0A336JK61_9BRAD|nr:hypothetical protein BJ125_101300 [Rhodopseudomonas pentothenatexigens]REG08372.1 hypothetical protein BJ123_101300 [Rhodopseudomonas thermotolerans]SSW89183.1 hypothetical protein SAMN05892882_101300 [Rhodopseudomonas pentothenatexigens]